MLDKQANQEQNQNQIVSVGGEHGRIETLTCYYNGLPDTSLRQIKVLIYQGKVSRVFCRFFDHTKCTQPHNETNHCYLFEN